MGGSHRSTTGSDIFTKVRPSSPKGQEREWPTVIPPGVAKAETEAESPKPTKGIVKPLTLGYSAASARPGIPSLPLSSSGTNRDKYDFQKFGRVSPCDSGVAPQFPTGPRNPGKDYKVLVSAGRTLPKKSSAAQAKAVAQCLPIARQPHPRHQPPAAGRTLDMKPMDMVRVPVDRKLSCKRESNPDEGTRAKPGRSVKAMDSRSRQPKVDMMSRADAARYPYQHPPTPTLPAFTRPDYEIEVNTFDAGMMMRNQGSWMELQVAATDGNAAASSPFHHPALFEHHQKNSQFQNQLIKDTFDATTTPYSAVPPIYHQPYHLLLDSQELDRPGSEYTEECFQSWEDAVSNEPHLMLGTNGTFVDHQLLNGSGEHYFTDMTLPTSCVQPFVDISDNYGNFEQFDPSNATDLQASVWQVPDDQIIVRLPTAEDYLV
jgi:hypothetical protein